MNDSQKNKELLNISLVIDDNNITHIDIDAKKTENVNFLIGKVCKKYNLDDKVNEKLGKEINMRIDCMIENNKKEKKIKTENSFNRLYYESIVKNKEKEAFLEKIRIEKENKISNNFRFSPNLNKNTNLLYEKTYLKIEDKLYNEFKLIKEKQNYTRLITEISQRSNSNNKNKSKKTDSKYNTDNDFHKCKKLIRKNSRNFFNLKENKSQRNLVLYKTKTLSKNFKEKNLLINNDEFNDKINEKNNSILQTYNLSDINSNLNLAEVWHINKIKNYNTEESFDDSCLNLKALQNKYKLDEKSNLAFKYPADNRDYEIKVSETNQGISKINFIYHSIYSSK
jgi:hypothetical protein